MPPAALPPDEPERLRILEDCRLWTLANDQTLSAIARTAARLLDAPIALVSIVDESEQRFLARVGLAAEGTPRDQAFCAYAVHGDELLVVEDAVADPRFADNPLVLGAPGIRFYAGAPLRSAEGARLGTLCAIDRAPRRLGPAEAAILRDLADCVERVLAEHRRNCRSFERLGEALEQAEEANRSKMAFLANMSHELRTPLNAIIGFAELIVEGALGPVQPARYADYVRDIHDSGRHLLGLINQVLDFSRLEIDQRAPVPERFDLRELVAWCLRLTAEQAAAAGVELRAPAPGRALEIFADPGAVRQILLNLLGNAVKFTPAGGHVALEYAREGEAVVLRVADSGIGIAPEQQAHVFEPFAQVEADLARSHGGVGLGLPISRQLAERNGGSLSLDSALGQGTTVTLRLPRAEPLPAAAPSPAVRLAG